MMNDNGFDRNAKLNADVERINTHRWGEGCRLNWMLTLVRWVCLNRLKFWSECLLIICKIESFRDRHSLLLCCCCFPPSLSLFQSLFFSNNMWTCVCVYSIICCSRSRNSTKNNSIFVWHFTNLQNTLLFILELKSAFAVWWQLTFHLCACHLTLHVWWELWKMWSICTHFAFLFYSFHFFCYLLSIVDCWLFVVSVIDGGKLIFFVRLFLLFLYAFDVYVNDKKSLLGVNFKAICCVIYLFVLFTFRFDMHLLLNVTTSILRYMCSNFPYWCRHHLRSRCHCHHIFFCCFPNVLSPICCR